MKLPKEYEVCLGCGYCTPSCPVARERGFETFSPRGKLHIIKRNSRFSIFDWLLGRRVREYEMAKPMFDCMLCGRCDEACHTRLKLADFFEDYRGKIAERVTYNDAHARMIESINSNGNPLGEPREKRNEFVKGLPEVGSKGKAEVLYFVGCVTSYVHFKVEKRTLDVMMRAGLDVATLGNDEECCGRVLRMLGRADDFRRTAKRNVEKIVSSCASTVVTGCPGCYKALKQHYPEALGKDALDGIRILHTSELFLELAKQGKLARRNPRNSQLKYVWHDPCELARGCGVVDAPRELLGVLGIAYHEFSSSMRESDCCGGGGAVRAIDENLSTSIGKRKIEEAFLMGANAIITSCPSCISTFSDSRCGSKIEVLDIAELVAAR